MQESQPTRSRSQSSRAQRCSKCGQLRRGHKGTEWQNCSLCICCGSKWNSCSNNSPLSPNNNSLSWIVTKEIENQSRVINFILTHNISPPPYKFHLFHNSLVCIASSMSPCNNNNIEHSVTVTIHFYNTTSKFIDSHTHLENRDEEWHNHRPDLPHSLSHLHGQYLYSKRILLLWLLQWLNNSSKYTYEKYQQVVFKF